MINQFFYNNKMINPAFLCQGLPFLANGGFGGNTPVPPNTHFLVDENHNFIVTEEGGRILLL